MVWREGERLEGELAHIVGVEEGLFEVGQEEDPTTLSASTSGSSEAVDICRFMSSRL